MQTWLLARCDLKAVTVVDNRLVGERRLSGLSCLDDGRFLFAIRLYSPMRSGVAPGTSALRKQAPPFGGIRYGYAPGHFTKGVKR
jgi:hypothetical protein